VVVAVLSGGACSSSFFSPALITGFSLDDADDLGSPGKFDFTASSFVLIKAPPNISPMSRQEKCNLSANRLLAFDAAVVTFSNCARRSRLFIKESNAKCGTAERLTTAAKGPARHRE